MQYILTEQEYNELKVHQYKITRDKLQALCTKIAETMPVEVSWRSGSPEPWGCILDSIHGGCCDECPVQDICPNEDKEWSQ
jgi:hypothetical protein